MVRTQIQLTEDQMKKLREISSARQESIASLIRRAVDQFMLTGKPGRSTLYRQARSVAGKFTSDRTDVAVQHDRYLEEEYDQ
jgi:hypothetical protein